MPSATTLHVIDQLRRFGETRRGWLGVRIQSVTDSIADSLGMDKPMGALVASVTPDSPAAEAGIEVGDVILTFDGSAVESMRSLPRLVARTSIGKAAEVVILRNDKKKMVKVTIGRLPKTLKTAAAEKKKTEEPEKTSLLGLSISPMSDELRAKYKIGKAINGVVITEIDPDSNAAQKQIVVGNVIVEVKGTKVTSPEQVKTQVEAARKSGRKSVLLLIANMKGDLRFVAVAVEDK